MSQAWRPPLTSRVPPLRDLSVTSPDWQLYVHHGYLRAGCRRNLRRQPAQVRWPPAMARRTLEDLGLQELGLKFLRDEHVVGWRLLAGRRLLAGWRMLAGWRLLAGGGRGRPHADGSRDDDERDGVEDGSSSEGCGHPVHVGVLGLGGEARAEAWVPACGPARGAVDRDEDGQA